MTIKNRFLSVFGFSLLLSACSSVPSAPDGFKEQIVETERMNFLTWEKENINKQQTLRFYIEGNGTPNPQKPVSLLLAGKDKSKNVVVLTRPCQYLKNKVCSNEKIWGKERYNPEILNEMYEQSLFYVKKYAPKEIEFVAYEDAAPIAFNLAQRYGKAKMVVTIAGVLDIRSYERQNELPTIKHKDFVSKAFVARTPQIHYIGSEDTVVTKSMTERYLSNLNNPQRVTLKVVHDMDHDDWDKAVLSY